MKNASPNGKTSRSKLKAQGLNITLIELKIDQVLSVIRYWLLDLGNQLRIIYLTPERDIKPIQEFIQITNNL